ncbi:MAG TPA: L-arabinose ABC transporter permease AraH [Armatimonadota bacterium]|jgi:L-arabinose transport system permease protein
MKPIADIELPAQRRTASTAIKAVWDSAAMAIIFGLLFIISSIMVPDFLSPVNMRGLALAVVQVGVVSCTMLFCLASGDFDLSPGAVVALAGVVAAVVTNKTGNVVMGMAAGVGAGGIVGYINGFVIARLGISAMIATLATQQIARGLTFISSNGSAVGVSNDAFYKLGNTQFIGVPLPVWVMAACFLLFGFMLNRTIFGRNVLAIGGNSEAAKLAGIDVARTRVIIFTLMGIAGGFAGIILASQMTSGQPNEGMGLELRVISACVLGGVSLTGGVGTMFGVIIGVLIMGTVQNVMNLLNIQPFWQYVVSGLVLLAAVLLDRLKNRATV